MLGPHTLALGKRTSARPTSCLSHGFASLLKNGRLRVRARDAVLQLPLQVRDLDRCLPWRGPVFDPRPQLVEQSERSPAGTGQETVAHSGELKVAVDVVYVWEKPGDVVVVLLDAFGGDQLVDLYLC